jgi:hypothetical protein
MRPEPSQVLIRMYGQGFGDCFLLAFPRAPGPDEEDGAEDARPVYVLIDCGVVAGTPDGPARMRSIVADINATTGGHLDLLIITHEHWDHLSGFVQAKALWEELTVDALWVAWTELNDPEGLPDVLKKILEKQHHALLAAADLATRHGVTERYAGLMGLVSFLAEPAEGQLFAAAGVGDAFEIAKGLVAEEQRVYCEPGDVRRVPGTSVSAYVLGPPRADEWLRKVHPSSVTPETYGHLPLAQLAEGRSEFNAFVMPLLADFLAAAEDDPAVAAGTALDLALEQDLLDRSFPFDRTVRIPLPLAEAEAATAAEQYPALASYFDPVNHWRRIDADWLAAAEAFALQADALTNNTSLALAFELPAPEGARKVLLFPGDAQVGALLSWDELPAWQALDGASPAQAAPDMPELLGRTIFYKVGHHGSHNATLKAKGVERMRADGTLTAFVPVSLPVARQIKGWDRIPLDDLLDALDARADERVVLPDGSVWPLTADESAAARGRLGVSMATERLPAKVRTRDGVAEQIEAETPLWVQIGISW